MDRIGNRWRRKELAIWEGEGDWEGKIGPKSPLKGVKLVKVESVPKNQN